MLIGKRQVVCEGIIIIIKPASLLIEIAELNSVCVGGGD
jgi:hypothetical protein